MHDGVCRIHVLDDAVFVRNGDADIRCFNGFLQFPQQRLGLLAVSDFLLQPRVFFFQLLLQLPNMQVIVDADEDFFGLKRLADIINAPGLKRFDFIERILQRADENDRNLAGFLVRFQQLADLIPRQIGHHNVQKNNIRRF